MQNMEISTIAQQEKMALLCLLDLARMGRTPPLWFLKYNEIYPRC